MTAKKQKQKIYFALPLTRKRSINITKSLLHRIGLVFLGLFIILSVGLGSGTLQFATSTVRCLGLPVQTSNFMASYTYYLPGDEGYKPGLFSSYRYCTKQQAEAGGYRPAVMSEEAKKEAVVMQQAREEAKLFSTEKVDYQVFIPVISGYSVDELRLSEIQGNQHTFMRIKKNGTVIGQIRELRSEDSYNICTQDESPSKAYCQIIGYDSEGREIKRYFRKGLKEWGSNYVGININGTGIILTSDNDTEAVQILSELKKYEEGLIE